MLDKKNIRIGFSIGDLNGIGGELILKIIKPQPANPNFHLVKTSTYSCIS